MLTESKASMMMMQLRKHESLIMFSLQLGLNLLLLLLPDFIFLPVSPRLTAAAAVRSLKIRCSRSENQRGG